jgi:cell division protein FtsB
MLEEVVSIGEKMFGSQFWSEWAGRVLHAGHRDNRDKEKLRKNNQKLAAAITKKGHKVKWDKEGLEFTVTLDPKSDREAEAAHAPYIALLAKKRGVTEDVSHLTEVKANTTLSAAAAQANGLKRVDGKSGDIESGMIVTNGTAYGVFVGSTTGGTVIIQWAKGGILNLVALEKLRAKWL